MKKFLTVTTIILAVIIISGCNSINKPHQLIGAVSPCSIYWPQYRSASDNKNPQICFNISDEVLKGEAYSCKNACLVQYAEVAKDVNYCDYSPIKSEREQCYFNIAGATHDFSICNKITGVPPGDEKTEQKRWCYGILDESMKFDSKQEDKLLCSSVKAKDFCYIQLINTFKECDEKLTDNKLIDMCYAKIIGSVNHNNPADSNFTNFKCEDFKTANGIEFCKKSKIGNNKISVGLLTFLD